MVDSFNPLGTTRDITDLLEFIWKLLADTQDIYVSADGQHTNHTTISTIANDVHRLGDIINVSVPDDDVLKGLVKESKKIATDLLKALDQLKVQGRNTVWKSFMLALKNVWKDRNIQAFSHRLATLQSQVACHCQAVILQDVSGISRKLADLEDMNKALGTDIRTEIRQLRDDIKSAAERLNPEDPAYGVHPMMKRLKVKGDTSAFDKQLVDDITSNLRYFSGKISHLYKTSKATDDIHNVLQSLNFDRRSLRERKIPEAHARTFDWIFRKNGAKENTSLSFVDWLRNRSGIFWIRGKAGSGKSTLMKFLSEHQETKRHLSSWAGNQTLIVARFFFWYAGLPLQKSQEGLLRSLLFEILRQCPGLIPRVLSIRSQFRDYYDDDDSWTPEELLSVCRGISGDTSDSRFCFFIDGLDEYEESGMSPTDLIKTIKSLGDSPNIKLCVSSRPWSAFVDEFGQHPESLLKLEDLTQDDIRRYVVDKFGESQQFIQAKEGYLQDLDLVESVCKKAAGVFLWVYLVVHDLLHGLTNGDSVSLLRQRLEEIPEDLEDYFQHMIDTIPSIYLGHAARAFDIARSAAEPPVILAFSFMDEAEEGLEPIIRLPSEMMSESEITSRLSQVQRRLDAQCKGLLEVADEGTYQNRYYRFKMDFLHRTVRDFLFQSASLGRFIEENLRSLDTSLFMCRAMMAVIKRAPLKKDGDARPREQLFHCLLDWALQSEKSQINTTEVVKILSLLEPIHHSIELNNTSWLGLVCERGPACYVKAKLADKEVRLRVNGPGRPLLHHALRYVSRIHPEIVKTLLENGANCNQMYEETSSWTYFLDQLGSKPDTIDKGNVRDVLKALISHGADLHTLAYGPQDSGGLSGRINCLYGEKAWREFSRGYNRQLKTVGEIIEDYVTEEEAKILFGARSEKRILRKVKKVFS